MIKRYSASHHRRQARVRAKIRGTAVRPRLTVFRSNRYIYVQLVDDAKGVTLASANGKNSINSATQIGTELAQKTLKLGVKSIVFDRGPYKYHGRVKALAQAAREAGLIF